MPESAAVAVSVGAQLRTAREAANLSLDEVAHALKFSPLQIERLEADDFAALPGNTIVRGFVRSYARLLKLDVATLLELLDAVMPNSLPDVRPPDNMGIAAQPGGLRELSPLVSIVAVVLLAAILLALWHYFGPSSTRQASVVSRGESVVSVSPAARENPSTPVPPSASAPTGNGAAPAPDEAIPALPQAPENPATALKFSFGERSWLEVTDATKRILHSGENPAGTQLTLNGRPPYDIVIGNAGKVTLNYGERRIDLAPYMRAEVARLTLE